MTVRPHDQGRRAARALAFMSIAALVAAAGLYLLQGGQASRLDRTALGATIIALALVGLLTWRRPRARRA